MVHAYNGFTLFNIFGGVVNRWVLLVAMITGMVCAADAIHLLVEVRFAPRLNRALIRLADAADGRLRAARRRAARSGAARREDVTDALSSQTGRHPSV